MTGRGVAARRALPFVATLLTVAVIGVVASAHHSDLRDPNDTTGPLDIHEVKLAHVGQTQWTVLTFAPWKARTIWDRGNFLIFLDTYGKETAEYYVLVRSLGSELAGTLWRNAKTGKDKLVRPVEVARQTKYGVSARVPIKKLTFGEFRTYYRWWVQSSFIGDKCRHVCIDRAPNAGSLEQWRPGMSPDPTISPSPVA